MAGHCQGDYEKPFILITTNSTDTENVTFTTAFYLDWCEKLGYP
ncbi:hypothetical protein O6937_01590 [Chlamydia sp. 04-14]